MVRAGGSYRNQNRAIATQGLNSRKDPFFRVRFLVAVKDYKRETPRGHGGLGGTHDPGIERVCKVGHREGYELAAAAPQVARDERGSIAQITYRKKNAAAQFRTDIGGIIDHRRHGRCRNICGFCNVLDSRHSPS